LFQVDIKCPVQLTQFMEEEEEEEAARRRRRRYLFGSNSNDNEYDNIEHLNRARKPWGQQAGHPNTYNFLIIIKLLL